MESEENIHEWEFSEPSHLVDLERIDFEVNNVPLIHAKMYMRELFKNAPIVYGRLKEWALQNDRLTWHAWYE